MKMNRGITSLAAICLTLSISGCASDADRIAAYKREAEDIAATNIGPPPSNYEQLVKEWFTNNLKDPDSAHYGCVTKPSKTSYRSIDRDTHYYATYVDTIAYLVLAEVNAKNSYGGYAGWTTYFFYIKGGRIIEDEKTGTSITTTKHIC